MSLVGFGYVVVEFKNGNPLAIHKFSITDNVKPSSYPQVISVGAFRNNQDCSKPNWFHVKTEHDHNFDVKVSIDSMKRCFPDDPSKWTYFLEGLPEYTHRNCWEFYIFIGYDYKKKKYK